MQIITELSKTIKERLKADPKKSYVALLHDKGLNKILEKIAEESTEVILAAKDTVEPKNNKEHVTEEVADLWFHCMVMLAMEVNNGQQCLFSKQTAKEINACDHNCSA